MTRPIPDPGHAGQSSPAAVCRWVGAAAVVLSGATYLLQGVEQISLQARTWAYLAVMAGLAAGGVVSRLAMHDAKGARVFFGLAIALVPLQFSQIGGMIHELLAGSGAAPAAATALFDYSGVTGRATASILALTLCIAPVITYAGCAILARAHARRLTVVMLALCLGMLLPVRASAAGFALLAGYVLVALVLEQRWFRRHAEFRTPEGRALRLVLVLPLAIVAGRTAFHVDTLTGTCAFAALLGLFIMRSARLWTSRARLRSLIQGMGVLAAAGSWIVYVTSAADLAHGGYLMALALSPVTVLLLDASRLDESAASFYRLLASLIVPVMSLGLVGEGSTAAALLAFAAGALLGGWGVWRRVREPVLVGALASAIGTCGLIACVLRTIDVSAWVALALTGAALVLGSSLLERYGRSAAQASRAALAEVQTWR